LSNSWREKLQNSKIDDFKGICLGCGKLISNVAIDFNIFSIIVISIIQNDSVFLKNKKNKWL
jgi:hypothetical protein